MEENEIEKMIREGIKEEKVKIREIEGDGENLDEEVVEERLRGKQRVKKKKMVYEEMKGNMGGVIKEIELKKRVKE